MHVAYNSHSITMTGEVNELCWIFFMRVLKIARHKN